MKTEEAIIAGSAIIALAIVIGGVIISERLTRAVEEKNLWEGSNIPQVLGDVRGITQSANTTLNSWIRA